MTPLQKIAMGLVIVVVDSYLAGFDAVPDVLGWALALTGLWAMRSRVPGFEGIATSAVLSGLVSLALLRPDWTADLPESTGWLLSLPQLVFTILLCGALATLAREQAADVAQRFRILRGLFVVLVIAPALVYGGGVDALIVPLAVVTVLANVYLIYLLFRVARHESMLPA